VAINAFRAIGIFTAELRRYVEGEQVDNLRGGGGWLSGDGRHDPVRREAGIGIPASD
jgi:hypothetical protein